jgi:hypothetical protein
MIPLWSRGRPTGRSVTFAQLVQDTLAQYPEEIHRQVRAHNALVHHWSNDWARKVPENSEPTVVDSGPGIC